VTLPYGPVESVISAISSIANMPVERRAIEVGVVAVLEAILEQERPRRLGDDLTQAPRDAGAEVVAPCVGLALQRGELLLDEL
jgi:hypothetical protein